MWLQQNENNLGMTRLHELVVILGLTIAFALPLTTLIPDFSIWQYIPKYQVTRYPVAGSYLTWQSLNTAVIVLLVVFFCLYLEIRKRKLDDMVENILRVSQATDATLEVEKKRQSATMKICVEMLNASTDHYEHLMMLHDEFRKRKTLHNPPAIEPSTSLL